MSIIIGSLVILICVLRTVLYIIYTIKENNIIGGISLIILLAAAVAASAMYIL